MGDIMKRLFIILLSVAVLTLAGCNSTVNETTEADISYEETSFPEPFRAECAALFEEMDQQVSTEAKIYKALDKLEAVIQHNEADIATWIPLEYDLQLSYGTEQVAFSDYFIKLKEEINRCTRQKIMQSE